MVKVRTTAPPCVVPADGEVRVLQRAVGPRDVLREAVGPASVAAAAVGIDEPLGRAVADGDVASEHAGGMPPVPFGTQG
jgi:hypothetical protein